MKHQISLMTWFFLVLYALCTASSAQSPKTRNDDSKPEEVVITMKQEVSRGWGGGVNSPYTVTISGSGTVTFDGMDEGKAVSKYEPPVKVLRKYKIAEKLFKELISEFYRIDFFSLENQYQSRDNGDGTFTFVSDGGLATVITTISINGKTKSVTNINFAPEKLIGLQRKIYSVSKISDFVKLPPYWLSRFPNEIFPPRRLSAPPNEEKQETVTKAAYRKIPRSAPKWTKEKYIDLNRKWRFITPCLTTKAMIGKLLGKPINTNDKGLSLPTYDIKNEKIRVFYSNEKTADGVCGGKTGTDTVILFSVIPIKDTKLSELKIDLTKFKKIERLQGREITYNNPQEGIFIETEIVEFSDKKLLEMVTSIQFSKRNSQK